jgi:hypothetical protein
MACGPTATDAAPQCQLLFLNSFAIHRDKFGKFGTQGFWDDKIFMDAFSGSQSLGRIRKIFFKGLEKEKGWDGEGRRGGSDGKI